MEVKWRAIETPRNALEEDSCQEVELLQKRRLIEHVSVKRTAYVIEALSEPRKLVVFIL